MVKLLVGALLALTAANSIAGSMYISKDKDGQVSLAKITPISNSNKFTKNVIVTKYSNNVAKKPKTYTTSEVVAMPSVQGNTYVSGEKTSVVTDNVAKYYKPVDLSQSDMENFEYRKATEKVKIIKNNDIDETHNQMISNNYTLLGSSVFLSREIQDSAFLPHAKKLGANSVVIHLTGGSSISYAIDDMNEVDPNSLPHVYRYTAEFYVKDDKSKKPGQLGVFYSEIPIEKRNSYQRNTGAYVKNITKGSRAYIANIVPEDVVIAINGKNIIEIEDFTRIKNDELKIRKDLVFTIIRLVNNEPREIKIPVSFS